MSEAAFRDLFRPFVLCFRPQGVDAECEEIKRYGREITSDRVSQAGRDWARVSGKGPGTIEFWRDGEPEARYTEEWS